MSLSPFHTLVLTPSLSVCSISGMGVSGSGCRSPSLWSFISLSQSLVSVSLLSRCLYNVSVSLSVCLCVSPPTLSSSQGCLSLTYHPLCLSGLCPSAVSESSSLTLSGFSLSLLPCFSSLSLLSLPPFFLPHRTIYQHPSTTSSPPPADLSSL